MTALAPHLSASELQGPVVVLRIPRGLLLLMAREASAPQETGEDAGTSFSSGEGARVLEGVLLPEP